MRRTVATTAATMLSALLLVAGCSPQSPQPSDDRSRPGSGQTPQPMAEATATDLDTATLPLDQYALTARQLADLEYANRLLAAACMRQYGIDWDPGERGDYSVLMERTNRLGIVDAQQAASVGYHIDPAHADDYEKSDEAAGREPLSPQAQQILTGGLPGQPTSGEVPDGGCFGEAHRELGWDPKDAQWFQLILSEAYSSTVADDRAQAVYNRWSACMSEAGYDYDHPVDAAENPRWNTEVPPSREEINTAVADVACKHEINYLGEMTTILTAHQQQLVAQHHERLQAVKEQTQAALAHAAQVLAGQLE